MSVPLRWQEEAETVAAPEIPARVSTPRRKAARRAQRGRRLLFASAVCLLAVGLALAGGQVAALRNGLLHQTPALALTPAPASQTIAMGAVTTERRLGFLTVTGSVTNRTAKPLSNVEAVVELLDSHQQTVQVENALVAFATLPAGQSAPFQVEMPDNTRVVSYRVRFRQLLGAALN